MKSSKKFNSQLGQGLTEYAVVLSLVALASIFAVSLLGGGLRGKFGELTGLITGNESAVEEGKSRIDSIAKNSKKESSRKSSGMKSDSSYTNKMAIGSEE